MYIMKKFFISLFIMVLGITSLQAQENNCEYSVNNDVTPPQHRYESHFISNASSDIPDININLLQSEGYFPGLLFFFKGFENDKTVNVLSKFANIAEFHGWELENGLDIRKNTYFGVLLNNGELLYTSNAVLNVSLSALRLMMAGKKGGAFGIGDSYENIKSDMRDLSSMKDVNLIQYISQQLRTYDIKEIRIRNEKFSNLEQFHSAKVFDALFNNMGEKTGNPDLYRYSQSKSFTRCPDNNHPHAIDLGLPSGTKWACCNVGASSPEEYGGYYAWGETMTKNRYDWNTYKHCDGMEETCHNIGNNIAGTRYDVAHVKWGGSWCMPSVVQIKELINNCSRKMATHNSVNGIFVTGPNGGMIFLPFAGFRLNGDLGFEGKNGFGWSSLFDPNDKVNAYYFGFGSEGWGCHPTDRKKGQTVRAVCP